MASKKYRGKHAPGAQAELSKNAVEQEQVSTTDLSASTAVDQAAAASSNAAQAAVASPYAAQVAGSNAMQDAATVFALPDSYKPIDLEAHAARRRRRKVKIFLIVLAAIIVLLAAVYGGVGLMFSSRFLPNTTIGDFDVSMKTDEEVVKMLQGHCQGHAQGFVPVVLAHAAHRRRP